MELAVKTAGGINVGRLIQRRGVSRSRRAGGASRMDQSLTQRALFGSGKLQELATQTRSSAAEILLIYNSLTDGQRKALAELTGCKVVSFLGEISPVSGT